MDVLEAEFVLSAASSADLPPATLPEVAFIGRSNVGKSSLLNLLLRRRDLARVSATPGKTRLINFYQVAGGWMFADLPGFGYAKVARSERAAWRELASEYLSARDSLKLVCYLVDSRHDPTPIDLWMLEWLEELGRPFIVVLTKIDKIGAVAADERVQQLRDLLQFCRFNRDIVATSAKTRVGRANVLALIKRACAT